MLILGSIHAVIPGTHISLQCDKVERRIVREYSSEWPDAFTHQRFGAMVARAGRGAGFPMGYSGAEPDPDDPQVMPLCDAWQRLSVARGDLDQRIARLPPDAPERDELWDDLQTVMASLHDTLERLALAPSADLAELRRKSAVLSQLVQSGDATALGSALTALTLSLTDDIARLPG
jgi:hypothetical protein